MKLSCPNCSAPIPAENINIQRMAAVCPVCNTVFEFNPAAPKIKRRKVKQPVHLSVEETGENARIAFRTNFRLDRNMNVIFAMGFAAFFTFLTAVVAANALVRPSALLYAAGFGLFTAILYYWIALMVYNKTQIDISDSDITISRRPLPGFLTQPRTISLSGIEKIRYEETPVSRKENYDTPRFDVWAETVDGARRVIVQDVIEEYAVFIAQRMEEYLELDGTSPALSLPDDDDSASDDMQAPDKLTAPSRSART